MSNLCLVNLKQHSMEFEELDILSKKLIKLSLEKKNIAFHFNALGVCDSLIKQGEMRYYFLVSDSYLYWHFDSLRTGSYYENDVKGSFEKWFYEEFGFFSDVLEVIFDFPVKMIEIYISNQGPLERKEDFKTMQTTPECFLKALYQCALESEEMDPCGFLPTRFTIER